MSEGPERNGLGGIARSIDALFSAGPAGASAVVDEAGAGPESTGLGLEHGVVGARTADHLARLVADLAVERDDDARHALFDACAQLGLPAAAALAEALSRTEDRFARRSYLDALVSMAPTSLPVVEAMLDDPRWFVVRNGAAVLGEVGDVRAVGLLTRALARPEPKVRREAIRAFAKLGGDDAGQLAFGMLDDPDAGVRAAAVATVGQLGVDRAVRPLMKMLDQEDDPDLTLGVLHALGHLGDPGAVNAIERHAVGSFLRRSPPDVRIAAYRALRHIGTPRARRLLNQAVDDRDPSVKAEVRRLLGM